MKKIVLPLFLVLSAFSFSQTAGAGVTDIDGNNYPTVIIGTQEWMKENLRVTKYSNGDPIPNITDNTQWGNLTSGAWVHYNNDSQYEYPYGKLYNWFTVDDSRNVCPTGWHVPTDAEWSTLINYLDPNANGGEQWNNAGGKMKTTGTQYWQSPNIAGNESGFSALPCGYRSFLGTFGNIGIWGYYWSSTLMDDFITPRGWTRDMHHDTWNIYRNSYAELTQGLPVRCVNNISLETIDLNSEPKQLLKITDLMGREVEERPNTVLIYMYTDGTIERKYIIE